MVISALSGNALTEKRMKSTKSISVLHEERRKKDPKCAEEEYLNAWKGVKL